MRTWVLSLSDRRKRTLFHSLFFLDAVLGLFPPLYWAAGSPAAARSAVPWSLVYFLATGLFIVMSVVAVQYVEHVRGELD